MSDSSIAFTDGVAGEAVRSALRSAGLVRCDSAFPAVIAERFYDAASALFALAQETKVACLRHGMTGGFTPTGVEGVRGHGPDFSRSFWDTLNPADGENRYPECAIGRAYQSAATELFSQVEVAVSALLRSTYPDVGAIAQNGRHLLRASSYVPAPDGQVVFPSHVDFGLITVYVGGARSGLQGLIDNVWTDLQAPAGDLFMGAGTTLRMYDPAVVPLRHRVVGIGEPRISAVFFTEPRGDTMLPNGSRASDHLLRLVSEIRNER